jgi:hypothetical protein
MNGAMVVELSNLHYIRISFFLPAKPLIDISFCFHLYFFIEKKTLACWILIRLPIFDDHPLARESQQHAAASEKSTSETIFTFLFSFTHEWVLYQTLTHTYHNSSWSYLSGPRNIFFHTEQGCLQKQGFPCSYYALSFCMYSSIHHIRNIYLCKYCSFYPQPKKSNHN